MSEMALEECRDLGRLIKMESYYIPPFAAPDYIGNGVTEDKERAVRLDALKLYQIKLENEVSSATIDPEKLWLIIIKTHKVDCASNMDAVKKPERHTRQ